MYRLIMMYGDSGSTKTTQLYYLAKYLLEKNPGKKILMVHAAPGGYVPFVDSGMIARKEVDVFEFRNRSRALADIRRLSKGYWPRKAKDPKTGEVKEFFQTDDRCLVNWDTVCGYFVEGLDSLGECLLNHASNQDSGLGFKETWKYEEDGETILGLQQGHYGIVQKELRARIVDSFTALKVDTMAWTALVGKGTEDESKETIYGPLMVGNATVAKCPSWFGDCFHLAEASVEKDGTTYRQKVAWFQRHTGSNGSDYLAKPRVMPELMPKLLEKFPKGYIPLGYKGGIDKYYREMDRIMEEYFRK